MVERIRKVIIVFFWLVAFGLPIAFLLAGPAAILPAGPLVNLYSAGVHVVGESAARFLFGVSWLVLDTALFWRFAISRRTIDSTPLEGLAD